MGRLELLGQYTRSAAWASPAQVHRTPGSLRDGLLNINDGARLPTTTRPSTSPFQTFADTAMLRTRSHWSLDDVGHGRPPLPARTHATRSQRGQVLAGGRVPGGATRESNTAVTLPLRRRGTAHSTTDGGECWTSMALRPLMIPTTQRRLLPTTAWSLPPPPLLGSPPPGLATAAAWRTTACSAASPASAARPP